MSKHVLVATVLAGLMVAPLLAQEAKEEATPAAPPAATPALGTIKGPSFDQAKKQALAWLQTLNPDAATTRKVEEIWNPAVERTVLERVAETIVLADPEAAKLVATARNPAAPAPAEVPAVLKDASKSTFYRNNLALYLARLWSQRRVYDESLAVLQAVRPEQVVDPASYYFFKAVAEDKLLRKREGLQSVERLLSSVADVPERYSTVARLMKEELSRWAEDDLGDIARRMEEVEGRLEIARGGPKTQKKQEDILDRLKKEIEEMEQQLQQMQQMAQGNQSNNPMPMQNAEDSRILGGAGEGKVDRKKLIQDLKLWGKMPEKERIKAMEAIAREYPPHFREAIEGYLKELSKGTGK